MAELQNAAIYLEEGPGMKKWKEDGVLEIHEPFKEDELKQHLMQPKEDQQKATPNKRVVTLDVFRGLTIAVMVLADDAGGEWPHINHSPWDGCTIADFVMPFFLFIVGVAIALAFKKVSAPGAAIRKVISRTFKLLFWGLILQGGYSHAASELSYGVDITRIRWCGVLQRIALGYMVVAIIEIATTTRTCPLHNSKANRPWRVFRLYKLHWMAAFIVTIIHFACIYGLYVPDWQFRSIYTSEVLKVTCGVRGHFGPACNAVGYVDRKVLGLSHIYQHPQWKRALACNADSPESTTNIRLNAPAWCQAPFEPEGILSSISSILSVILGVHYGHVLVHYKDHKERLLNWVIPGLILVPMGLILHYSHAIVLNKQLYSFSYLCLTGGAAALVFSALYVLIDVAEIRKPTLIFEWMGMNAMLVFVMGAEGLFPAFINGWYYKTPNNTLVHWVEKHIFIEPWHSVKVGTLLYVIFGEILFWGIICGLLHWQGIYWKL